MQVVTSMHAEISAGLSRQGFWELLLSYTTSLCFAWVCELSVNRTLQPRDKIVGVVH